MQENRCARAGGGWNFSSDCFIFFIEIGRMVTSWEWEKSLKQRDLVQQNLIVEKKSEWTIEIQYELVLRSLKLVQMVWGFFQAGVVVQV